MRLQIQNFNTTFQHHNKINENVYSMYTFIICSLNNLISMFYNVVRHYKRHGFRSLNLRIANPSQRR